jgi:farnesyl-diphosphate farnesyltransferase
MLLETRRVQRLTQGNEDLRFCYSVLIKVSRSFAVVIQQLPEELRDAVCVFYLVLRALDTVEDDMAVQVKRKVPLLQTFHEKISDPCAPVSLKHSNINDWVDRKPRC